MIGKALNKLVGIQDLQHGAIYKFHEYGSKVNTYARCNIDAGGYEYWFTDKDGREVAGRPIAMIKEYDESFRHYGYVKKVN